MDDIMPMINYIDGSASKNNGPAHGAHLRGVALSMLRPVSASILTKKGTLIIIQVQLEVSFDISDEFDFIDRIFFFFLSYLRFDGREKIRVSLVKTFERTMMYN